MARSRTMPATDDDEAVGGGVGDGDAPVGVKAAAPGSVQPLSRTQRLRQQSNMAFWLILKKKNDLEAKAARVQELKSMLEKIR